MNITITLWFALTAAFLVTGWHAVTEHHVHRRVLRRLRPHTAAPATSPHHAWWHSLSRPRRAAIQAALLRCAAAFGPAYPLAPAVVIVIFALAVLAAAGLGVRSRLRARRAPSQITGGQR